MAKKNTIVEDIRLTGGAEIETQFNELGDAGRKAFAELKAAANDVTKTDLEKFLNGIERDLRAVQKQAKVTATAWKDAGKATRDFARNVTLLTGAVAALAVGFVEVVKGAADAADEQNKAAQSAGLAQDQYAKLQFVFEQGNVDAASFGTAMKKLNTNIDQAAKGSGAGAKLFNQLGISVRDANGALKPTDTILQELSAKFQSLKDGPQKSALAIQLFGKAGAAMIPVLNDGAKAMKELEDRAVELGLVFTKEEAIIGDNFGDALNELSRTVDATKDHFALLFAPELTDFFKSLTTLIGQNKDAILAFGKSLADQAGPLLKDFISLLQGNDSAVQNKGLIAARDTIVSIGQALGIVSSILVAAFNELVDVVTPFVDAFNAIFGTKFTAQAVVISGVLLLLTGAFKAVGLGVKAIASSWTLLVKLFGSSAGVVAASIIFVVRALEGVDVAIKGLIGIGQSWAQSLQATFAATGAVIVAFWDRVVAGAQQTYTDIIGVFTQFGIDVPAIFEGLVASVTGFFSDLYDKATGFIDGIMSGLNAAIALAKTLLGLNGSDSASDSGSDGGSGFAGGGRIRGPGTGTSDSILARVSNGEYVVRAAAVRKYGVNALAALNNMRIPSARFALGGLVGASMPSLGALPAFAGGGPVGRPLSLHFPDGQSFNGLTAPETVATQLVRYATTKQMRSAGSRPSWRN